MSHHLAYFICATPRSGTTLLCDLLHGTGQAGRPRSYFRSQDIERLGLELGLKRKDFADQAEFDRAYLQAVLEAGAAGTGIFGLRLMRGTFDELLERLSPLYPGPNAMALFEQAFGPVVYVHVSRTDKLAQAISRLKAEQSGLWHMGADGTERERIAPAAPVVYDAQRIGELLCELEHEDAAWNAFFAREGVTPVTVTYEALAADPRAELRKILVALGQSPGLADGMAVQTSKLANAESQAWAERFRQALASR